MTIKRMMVLVSLICLGGLLLIAALSFVPTFSLEERGMHIFRGTYVTVYYEAEEKAARDVFALTEVENKRLAQKLGLEEPPSVNLYIYDKQSTFQTKKYGYVALVLSLDWYVGDNRGTNVLLTSPANPGKGHTYDEIKLTALHELVHAYNYVINPNMRLWINEGVALYLTNGDQPPSNPGGHVPTLAQTRSGNPLVFSQSNGYTYAQTYIEYLDRTYGWSKILVLLQTGDFIDAFGVGEKDIYVAWLEAINLTHNRPKE
ncbi:MAG: hypothetical protein FWG40_03950 [Peptococcaceae bacterium]|nr:hypothetical protein [Peptococcaceae bacterium]